MAVIPPVLGGAGAEADMVTPMAQSRGPGNWNTPAMRLQRCTHRQLMIISNNSWKRRAVHAQILTNMWALQIKPCRATSTRPAAIGIASLRYVAIQFG